MNTIIPELSTSQWFFVIAAVFFILTIVTTIKEFFRKKKKRKNKYKYQVTVFLNDQIIQYGTEQIQKIHRGKKYISVRLMDGTWIAYEGFKFFVIKSKIHIDESPVI
jgi:hypothetical protein